MRVISRLASSLALALLVAPVYGCAHAGARSPTPGTEPSLSSGRVSSALGPAPLMKLSSTEKSEIPTLDQWAWRYPDAARELGEWITSHRHTARALADWQGRHPEQMEALVDWSSTHPLEPLSVLFFDRRGWGEFRAIAGDDDDAQGFVSWIRRAPHAAREMAFYSNGLAFLDREAATLLRASYSEVELRENPLFRSTASHR